MSHRANFIIYAREHWTILHLSFTSSLNIFSSRYAHFEQLGSLELESLKWAISHVLNVIANVTIYAMGTSKIIHLSFTSSLNFFSSELCTFWATWFILCKGTLNHLTFVIYKQFEHFLFKQCTFSETWFLRAKKLEMFILGTFWETLFLEA